MNHASAAQSADECQKHVFHELWSCRGHFQPARRELLLYETAYQSKLNDFAHCEAHWNSGCCTRVGSSIPTAAAHTNTAQVTKKRAFLDGIKPPPKIKLSFRLLLPLSTHIQKSAVFFTPDPPQARFGSLGLFCHSRLVRNPIITRTRKHAAFPRQIQCFTCLGVCLCELRYKVPAGGTFQQCKGQ